MRGVTAVAASQRGSFCFRKPTRKIDRVMDDQPTSRRCPIDVFGYLDYRQFLADFYAAKKQARGFSYRAFSRIARLGAPNYLKLVIMGKRNLTPTMAARFATASTDRS